MDNFIVPQLDENTHLNCGGIYQWRQLSTGRKYIGSTVNFEVRKGEHLRYLNGNYHNNLHLLNAWKKYGADDFVFEILEVIEDRSALLDREQWYLDSVIDWSSDFNKARVAACPPDTTGMERTAETRAKISASNKGKVVSAETRAKLADAAKRREKVTLETRARISKSGLGRKHSPESKAKMSIALKGKVVSSETRAKLSAALKGRAGKEHTPEAKAKISKALKGRIVSPEARKKLSDAKRGKKMGPATPERKANISKANLGRKFTPETRAKMSIAAIARCARKREERERHE